MLWPSSLRFIRFRMGLSNVMGYSSKRIAGFSLVEVIIVSAVSVLIFTALLGAFKYSLDLINVSRSKLSALSVANERMEYIRLLPYDDVGVVSGFPDGSIPQNSVVTLNGIDFNERVFMRWSDDPADGLEGSDSNGITTDYKQVKLEYTWTLNGKTNSIAIVSNIVPRSIETNVGGGTAKINVLDADNTFLQGATVRIIGSSSTFPYDVTSYSDANGVALFPVPEDSGYQAIVTANISGHQYSTDQTYEPTVVIPTPVTGPFAVLEADVSTLTFTIGELSDLDILTRSAINEGVFKEDFDGMVFTASSSVENPAGALILKNIGSVYEPSGYIYLGPITPTPFSKWQTVHVATMIPLNTSHKVQLFTGPVGGPYVLIPDSELPGNAVGFTDSIIDISQLDVSTYPSIYTGITIETSDTSVTPRVEEISVFYRQGETALPNVQFDIRGNKIIGTDADSKSVYKYKANLQTNASGELKLADLEFDEYTLTFSSPAYDIAMACPAHPFSHQAGVDDELELVLVADDTNTLRVSVMDDLGRAVPGAPVNLTRTGYDETVLTNICGQAFFTGGLSAETDYIINVNTPGYINETVDPVAIDGDSVINISLSN